jgi:predicted permease
MLILPLALFFVLGYLFKTHFSYSEDAGQILSRLILNITLPPTIFLAAGNTENFTQAYFLPLAALSIQILIFGIFLLISSQLKLEKNTECVFITAPLINNTLFFLAPFLYLAYGDPGLTRLILYDIGNAITIYFIAQTLFSFYGEKRFNFIASLKIILFSPPLWAFALGLLFGRTGLIIPEFILKPLLIIKETNAFLPMFVLGFYFLPTLQKIKLVLFTISSRLLLGLLIGLGISYFFVNPLDKIIIIMAATAPVGLLSLIFASEHGRDTKFASDIVSYSMILGLFVCTAIDYIFRYLGLI